MIVGIVILLFAFAALGVPLFVVLGAGSLLAAWKDSIDPAVLVVEMMRLASSPNLMAIPLFTLTGLVLSGGGAAQRQIRLFNALFSWMPAGLAVVSVASCAFFTAFSGASSVTILALGGLLYAMLTREGYGQRFSLGLVTSSGSIGLLFPPSLVVLLYGIVAGVSIEQLFMAGLVPGILLLVMLSVYCMIKGASFGIKRQLFSWTEVRAALREGIWDVLMPIGIIGGMLGGIITVTEAATLAAAYALLLETVIHRTIHPLSHLPHILTECAILVGSIVIILSVAMGLTNLLIDAQLPMKVLAVMENSVTDKLHFLLLLNLFLLAVGFFMDIFSAIMVVVPLILPLAHRFGVDPVHLGIVFLANLEIGYLHPPMGLNLFLASQRFGEPIMKLFRAVLPFLGIMLIWLLLVTYVPEISLWWRKAA